MPLLEVKALRIAYQNPSTGEQILAVDGVSFKVEPGETLGIVGESGCGKSTLARALMAYCRPGGVIVGGEVLFDGNNILEFTDEQIRELRGRRMAMVPQEVPVAKAIAADVMNTITGMSWRATRSESNCERNCAVPTSSVAAPRDQASVKMTMAIIMAFIPPSQESRDSCMVRRPCPADIAIATRQPASEPQRSVAKGSAAPNTSMRLASGPSLARPSV